MKNLNLDPSTLPRQARDRSGRTERKIISIKLGSTERKIISTDPFALSELVERVEGSTISFICEANSQLDLQIFIKESCTLNIKIELSGPGASAKVLGICQLADKNDVEINIEQIHTAPNTESDVLVKSVLDGESKLDFKGHIFVAKEAFLTKASTQNKNLVLSEKAKVVSVPTLEVLTDDVKCAHGSAIGQVDQDSLYYLMSRGLDKDQAIKLLVDAFIQ